VNTIRRIYYALTGRVCPWVAKDLEVEKKKLHMERWLMIATVLLAMVYWGYYLVEGLAGARIAAE
jgi:hypothetical protein